MTTTFDKAAFKAFKAELLSMVPLAFRSMAKTHLTEEHVTRLLKAALSTTEATQESLGRPEESKCRRRDGWLLDMPNFAK